MYRKSNLSDKDDLQGWAEREFQAIEQEFNLTELMQLAPRNTEPERPRDGMITKADGVNWNPTAGGEGFYGYYAGAWHKLG